MFDFLEKDDGPEAFRKRILRRLEKNKIDYTNYYLLSVVKNDDSNAKKSKMLARTSSQSFEKFDRMPIDMLMQHIQNNFGDVSKLRMELADEDNSAEIEVEYDDEYMALVDPDEDIVRCQHCESEYSWDGILEGWICPVCGENLRESN